VKRVSFGLLPIGGIQNELLLHPFNESIPMATDPVCREVTKAGHRLVCPVCTHHLFWSRETLMNTRGASFFNLDWANKEATNYICGSCGYVYWFLDR
jgi:uncharacterized protein YbaR (Trm112 family)